MLVGYHKTAQRYPSTVVFAFHNTSGVIVDFGIRTIYVMLSNFIINRNREFCVYPIYSDRLLQGKFYMMLSKLRRVHICSPASAMVITCQVVINPRCKYIIGKHISNSIKFIYTVLLHYCIIWLRKAERPACAHWLDCMEKRTAICSFAFTFRKVHDVVVHFCSDRAQYITKFERTESQKNSWFIKRHLFSLYELCG